MRDRLKNSFPYKEKAFGFVKRIALIYEAQLSYTKTVDFNLIFVRGA